MVSVWLWTSVYVCVCGSGKNGHMITVSFPPCMPVGSEILTRAHVFLKCASEEDFLPSIGLALNTSASSEKIRRHKRKHRVSALRLWTERAYQGIRDRASVKNNVDEWLGAWITFGRYKLKISLLPSEQSILITSQVERGCKVKFR